MICTLIGPDHSQFGHVNTPLIKAGRGISSAFTICPHWGHWCTCSHVSFVAVCWSLDFITVSGFTPAPTTSRQRILTARPVVTVSPSTYALRHLNECPVTHAIMCIDTHWLEFRRESRYSRSSFSLQ